MKMRSGALYVSAVMNHELRNKSQTYLLVCKSRMI